MSESMRLQKSSKNHDPQAGVIEARREIYQAAIDQFTESHSDDIELFIISDEGQTIVNPSIVREVEVIAEFMDKNSHLFIDISNTWVDVVQSKNQVSHDEQQSIYKAFELLTNSSSNLQLTEKEKEDLFEIINKLLLLELE